jgi:hypothetical protein
MSEPTGPSAQIPLPVEIDRNHGLCERCKIVVALKPVKGETEAWTEETILDPRTKRKRAAYYCRECGERLYNETPNGATHVHA